MSTNTNSIVNEILSPVTAINGVSYLLRDECDNLRNKELSNLVKLLSEASFRLSHSIKRKMLLESIELVNYDYAKLCRFASLSDLVKASYDRLRFNLSLTEELYLDYIKGTEFIKINESHMSHVIDELILFVLSKRSKGNRVLIWISKTRPEEFVLTIASLNNRSNNILKSRIYEDTFYRSDFSSDDSSISFLCKKIARLHNSELFCLESVDAGFAVQLIVKNG